VNTAHDRRLRTSPAPHIPTRRQEIRDWPSKYPKRLAQKNDTYEPSAPVPLQREPQQNASSVLTQAETVS